MFDLRVPIVGTVLTQPERRVIEKSGNTVTSFRVVANYRRFDAESRQWVDYGLFRIRVNCWRRLGDHVFASLKVGEPVIVIGRVFTRDWRNGDTGELRVYYELEADSVGHDLSRGTTTFLKVSTDAPHSVIEDEDAEARIGGELSYAVDANGVPTGHDPYDGSDVASETAADAMAILRQAGMAGADTDGGPEDPTGGEDEDDDLVGVGSGGRRRRGR
jgi:single-strand DNA-binding protein